MAWRAHVRMAVAALAVLTGFVMVACSADDEDALHECEEGEPAFLGHHTIVDIDGDPLREIDLGDHVLTRSLSPDGRRVAVVRGLGQFQDCCGYPEEELVVLDVDADGGGDGRAGDGVRLASGRSIGSFAWSPDSRHLALAPEELQDTSARLVLLAADGSSERVVLEDPDPSTSYGSPGWFPDGEHLLFSRATAGDLGGPALWTVAVDGSDPHQLPVAEPRQARLSPDGGTVAYHWGGEPGGALFVTELSTGATRLIGTEVSGAQKWLSTGELLVLRHQEPGARDLDELGYWILDTATGDRSPIDQQLAERLGRGDPFPCAAPAPADDPVSPPESAASPASRPAHTVAFEPLPFTRPDFDDFERIFPPPPDLAPCTRDQLAFRLKSNSGFAFSVTNTSERQCQVVGHPRVELVDPATGDVIGPLGPSALGVPQRFRLLPGRAAVSHVRWDRYCGAATRVFMRLHVEGGTFDSPARRPPRCHERFTEAPQPGVDAWRASHSFMVEATDAHVRAKDLVATIDRASVREVAGDTAFSVVVENPTSDDVRIDPCPAYRIAVDGRATSYDWDCGAAAEIPANGAVAFEMRAGGTGDRLSWELLAPVQFAVWEAMA